MVVSIFSKLDPKDLHVPCLIWCPVGSDPQRSFALICFGALCEAPVGQIPADHDPAPVEDGDAGGAAGYAVRVSTAEHPEDDQDDLGNCSKGKGKSHKIDRDSVEEARVCCEIFFCVI